MTLLTPDRSGHGAEDLFERRVGRAARLCCALALLVLVSTASHAVDATFVSGPSATETPHVTVTDADGGMPRVAEDVLIVPLHMALQPERGTTSGQKIITQSLELRSGAEAGRTVISANPIHLPQLTTGVTSGRPQTQPITFALTPDSSVTMAAIAACRASALSSASGIAPRRTITVEAVWRFDVGRLVFDWRNYDRLASAEAVMRNADLYRDRESHEKTVPVRVSVICKPTLAQVDRVATRSLETDTDDALAVRRVTTSEASTARREPGEPPTQVVAVEEPQCQGGVVRLLGGVRPQPVCLCPANTAKVAMGRDAFRCQRKVVGR